MFVIPSQKCAALSLCESLKISGVHIFGFVIPLLLKYCTEVPFSLSFFQNKFGLKLLSFETTEHDQQKDLEFGNILYLFFLQDVEVKAKNCLFQIQNVTFVIFWVKSFDALNQIRLKRIFSGLKPPARASWILSADKKSQHHLRFSMAVFYWLYPRYDGM